MDKMSTTFVKSLLIEQEGSKKVFLRLSSRLYSLIFLIENDHSCSKHISLSGVK